MVKPLDLVRNELNIKSPPKTTCSFRHLIGNYYFKSIPIKCLREILSRNQVCGIPFAGENYCINLIMRKKRIKKYNYKSIFNQPIFFLLVCIIW